MNLQDPNWHNDISFSMPAYYWLSVHSNVCLALRQPENKGSSRTIALTFLASIESVLLADSLLTPDEISLIHKTGY